MKRIGIVVTNLAGSGAEKVALAQAKLFEDNNFSVVLFILDNVKKYKTSEYNFPIIPLSKGKDVYKILGKAGDRIYAKILKSKMEKIGKFDLIISNLPRADRVVKYLDHENKYFVIHMSYKTELEKFTKKRAKKKLQVYQWLYKNEKLITVAKSIIPELDVLNIDYLEAKTIYNPFDFESIVEKGKEVLDMAEPYMIAPSAFRRQKRYDILFEALRQTKTQVKLIILAAKTKEAQAMIQAYGLENRVEILGFQQNPYKYMKHAKLLVLSSEREGLPTVMIESLILGTPVVSTDCPTGPKEILVGALSHWLVPVNDSAALAKKIDEALESSIEIDMNELERFSKVSIFEQYVKLLKEQ